jgi:hypothetical protein
MGPAIDCLVRVAALFETHRHRLQRKIARVAGLELMVLRKAVRRERLLALLAQFPGRSVVWVR